jgi:glutathione S-transferase
MPVVYGVNASPFVRKVRVALAEKGVSYELEPVFPVNVSAEYRQISPLGKIPAYRDGERTLADSSVICAYIERVHPHPRLYPSDPYEQARALWFEEYGDTALSALLTGTIFFNRIVAPRFLGRSADAAAVQKAVDEQLPPMFDYLEGQIGDRDSIAGDAFSIGDIGLATQFVNARYGGFTVDAKRWPKLAAYVGNIHARPSFKALIDEEAASFGAA